jgi:hypothetical protein
MNYYYYPLSSKDFTFENIFSNESVSPPCVYKLRTFGTDFFNTLAKFHHSEAIILYGEVPAYELDKEVGDHKKFILKLPESILDPSEMVFISEKMIGYQKTIYLTKNNFELLFFSEKDIKVCSLKSEATLSTKSYKKYQDNFKVISDSDCRPFDTEILGKVKLDKDWKPVVEFDRKFNFFKGFCYGLLCGSLRSMSKKEAELKRSLQDVTNCFAEFKNKTSNTGNRLGEKGFIKKVKSLKDEDSAIKVSKAIESSEQLFKSNLLGPSFQESDIETFVKLFLANLGFEANSIKLFLDFKKMEDTLLGANNFSKFKSQFLKSDHKNPLLYFESLREQVKIFASAANSTADWAITSRDRAADTFKKIMYDLSKIADGQSAKPGREEIEYLHKLHYSIDDNEINLSSGLKDISSINLEEFVLILNIILKNPKLGKGEAQKGDILYLVDLIGSRLNPNKSGQESHLYQYLNGDLNEYDTSKVQSIGMKNFIAFVFNPDSVEKLESYLLAKSVPQKWMAYSFWSTFNGFASMSRLFVAPYFETSDAKITEPIDNYLSRFHKDGNLNEIVVTESSPGLPEQPITKPDESRKSKIDTFYTEFVDGKFKISSAQFEQIVELDDPEKMVSELKSKYRIAKKDGVKLIDRFKDIVKSHSLF